MSEDYGDLVTRLRNDFGGCCGGPGCKTCSLLSAAADAIEALKAIVSARDDMDVQHAEVIDQQAERIAALERERDRQDEQLRMCSRAIGLLNKDKDALLKHQLDRQVASGEEI